MTPLHAALPTLTEVIEIDDEVLAGAAQVTPMSPETLAPPAPHAPAEQGRDEIIALVAAELAPRIDALLQARLHEALAPQLALLAEEAGRLAADELARTLQVLVSQAVDDMLARRQGR